MQEYNKHTSKVLVSYHDLQLSPWLISLGFSLCFGTIMAKTGRIVCIFNSSIQKKLKEAHIHVSTCILTKYRYYLFTSHLSIALYPGLHPQQAWEKLTACAYNPQKLLPAIYMYPSKEIMLTATSYLYRIRTLLPHA